MNCPNCPSALIQPEGGVAYCGQCGWGDRDWYIKQYNEACGRVIQLQDEVRSLTHKLDVSDQQRTGLAVELERQTVPKVFARQVERDEDPRRGNRQLFCGECGKGAGDQADLDAGFLKKCPYCDSEGPFIGSADVERFKLRNEVANHMARNGKFIAAILEHRAQVRGYTAAMAEEHGDAHIDPDHVSPWDAALWETLD